MNASANDLFLRACRNEPVERVPVWMMRQAGRYMAAYREVRRNHDFWSVCRTPELAARVTLQPVDAFAPDAAILFSDILVVLPPMGVPVSFSPGPVIDAPVDTPEKVNALVAFDPHRALSFVMRAISHIRSAMTGRGALIGFGGAPLTLATYMVQGGKGRNFEVLKSFLYGNKPLAHRLLDFLVDVQSDFLRAQIEAGAQVIQLFDTWAGSMPRDIVAEFVVPKVATLVERLKATDTPVIYFMKDAAHVLDLLPDTGADVLSLDEKTPLDRCLASMASPPVIQGNMDSAVLLTDKQTITHHVHRVLNQVPPGQGHIFNLGHGVLPPTPEDHVRHLVTEVKRLGARHHP